MASCSASGRPSANWIGTKRKYPRRSRLLTKRQPREHRTQTPSNRIRPCGELMPPGPFGSTTIDCSACMESKHPLDDRSEIAAATAKNRGFTQPLAHRAHPVCEPFGRASAEYAHHQRLLRARRQWPGRRAAEQRYERAAFDHSITSSASNCNELGTSRPSALAVCRLMTNSNLEDWMTGSSGGLTPLRI